MFIGDGNEVREWIEKTLRSKREKHPEIAPQAVMYGRTRFKKKDGAMREKHFCFSHFPSEKPKNLGF